MFEAAIPVLAVTETTAGFFACFFLRAAIIARSSSDFPVPSRQKYTKLVAANAGELGRLWMWTTHVPAAPVKKTFFPSSTTISNTLFCSSFSGTGWLSLSFEFEETG